MVASLVSSWVGRTIWAAAGESAGGSAEIWAESSEWGLRVDQVPDEGNNPKKP